jgi:hypothetical protein
MARATTAALRTRKAALRCSSSVSRRFSATLKVGSSAAECG